MKQGWTYKPLGEIATFIKDGDWIESKDQSESGIRLIQTGNVGYGIFKIKDDKPHYITEETMARLGCTEIFEGDCLVSRLPNPVGRACLIPDIGYRMITAVDCSIIRFGKDYLPQFFVYYTQSYKYLNSIDEKTTGTTRKRISRKNLEKIQIPVPPLSEQERIVERLDAAFAQIDELKSNAERQLAEARALFQSALTQAMQPKPGWQEKPLKEITTKIGSGATPRGGKAVYIDNGVALIRSMNVHNGFFKYDNLAHISDEAANLLNGVELKQNDVLFNITGASIARCCVVPDDVIPARVNQHVAIIRPITDIVYPRFLSYVLMSKTHQKELLSIGLSGSTRQALTKKDLENHVVSLPSPDGQRVILDYLDNYSLKVRELERISRKTAAECDALKQALLRQIFE